MFIRGFLNYVLWQYLGILKTNQRSTVFVITYVNIRQFEFGQKRFEVHLCSEMYERAVVLIFDLWLLIIVAAADYLCVLYLYSTSLLSNYICLFIDTHKTLWPNGQDK